MLTHLYNLPLPIKPQTKWTWGNLQGSSLGFVLSQLVKNLSQPLIIVTPDTLSASQLSVELSFFLDQNIPLLTFPDRETLPYDVFSPHRDIISERLKVLSQLAYLKSGIIITAITTAMHYLAPQNFIDQYSFVLHKNESIDLNNFRQRLQQSGYIFVSQVIEHGEFTIRGSIIDIFPMGSKVPYRIDLFDNIVDSIRTFDPETQLTAKTLENINLLPAYEYPLQENAISLFRQNWRSLFPGNPLNSPIYQQISDGKPIAGIEYYLPLFFESLTTFFDYLPENSLIIKINDVHTPIKTFWEEVSYRYTQKSVDKTRPLLPPEKLFLKEDQVFQKINQFTQLNLHQNLLSNTKGHNLSCESLPNLVIDRKSSVPLEFLKNFIQSSQLNILIVAESAGRREVLLDLFKSIDINPEIIQDWQEFKKTSLAIIIGPLTQGFIFPNENFAVITEAEIFGRSLILQRKRETTKYQDPDALFRDLTELTIGSPIVHSEYGIGRYLGLQILTINEQAAEFLMLEYANHDKLYVPVSSLYLINRYLGPDAEHVHLNKLGTQDWARTKRKAAERIRDTAAELLKLYATRSAHSGFCYQLPSQEYLNFAATFPFETTLDQEKAIQNIIEDMTSDKSMDRLICGDVGFGKTEVAMRAAFLATENNKQVVVLVPTTLLADQHYQNFKDRFADWPQQIDVLSRFRSAKEQSKILEALESGKIDIIIGTHKLLQSEIRFKDLGLLIIDEEHRFGVKQKERIKQLRAHVDILTLTATPIPRTLNMAMGGIRDLSIIATPPARRLAIKTFVLEHNKQILHEAILRELMRGGQIFYLHNKVETIEHTARELQILLPSIRIGVAHGQMHEKQLEQVMSDFYHHRFNVLVCTTIIESGIDIPTANTIIIDKADKFGLAQLHQLRGRVGRSHHQAYAYLLISSFKAITDDAKKRLDAIASMEDLGAGFILATHDLEIRGAGELLGEEQSGNIESIGFSLYMEMLEQTVNALKSGETINLEEPSKSITEIDLRIPALIPDIYLPDVHLRLILYKRISNAKNAEDLDHLQVEMIDRFGKLPQATKNLFNITQLKLRAMRLGIKKIDGNLKEINVEFNEKPNIKPETIIQLIQTKPQEFKLISNNKLKCFMPQTLKTEELVGFVENIMETIGK